MLIASAKHIIKPMYCIYGSKTGCGVGKTSGTDAKIQITFLCCIMSTSRHKPYRNVSHSVFNTPETVKACIQTQATVSRSFFLMQAVCSFEECVVFCMTNMP